ncbi:MAG: TetR/AcrR family transcriptional regulator [Polyangiaceae bacterium]|nr:TetR/AcrR family transcriptional regulator [Polyangiaceae bacterium]
MTEKSPFESQPHPLLSAALLASANAQQDSSRAPASGDAGGLPTGKRAENRRLRTEALQRAALGLFLQYGVEAVTIDQIVDGARTAKGSFYRYFRDKTDLVASLVEPVRCDVRSAFGRCADGLREASREGNVAKPYEGLAQDLIRVVLQYPDVVRLYLHESRGPKNGARAPIVELSEEVLDGATELSNIAHGLGLVRGMVGRLSAIVVVGASELIVARLFAGDDVGPVLEMPGELVSLVLDGVRARKDAPPARAPRESAARPAAAPAPKKKLKKKVAKKPGRAKQ